ncbi:hypothetical protein ACS0TY_029588 [Phlomoides rotata]
MVKLNFVELVDSSGGASAGRRGKCYANYICTLMQVLCALLYGAMTGFWSPTYFDASAMLITFVLLGKYLESLAKGKTSDAIKKLVELAPATAILLIRDKGMYFLFKGLAVESFSESRVRL